ncbi:MAG: helix-turn-helix transcriptional regulator [Legionella sp.]|nr:helix-turn-helix transcriptional regulator [Legionella sp.]
MKFFIGDIPKRLKIIRVAAGYQTAKAFTDKNGIPASTYSQHENGKRSLSLENIVNYATLCHVDPAWLITGQGDPCENDLKYLQDKIFLEQERLEHIGELESNAIPSLSLEDRFSFVNVSLFKKILLAFFETLNDNPKFKVEEVLEFCFDLYNKILSTNATGEEQSRIILVCIDSFFKGLGVRNNDKTINKTAIKKKSL